MGYSMRWDAGAGRAVWLRWTPKERTCLEKLWDHSLMILCQGSQNRGFAKPRVFVDVILFLKIGELDFPQTPWGKWSYKDSPWTAAVWPGKVLFSKYCGLGLGFVLCLGSQNLTQMSIFDLKIFNLHLNNYSSFDQARAILSFPFFKSGCRAPGG